jgi:hypothetical protein
VQFLNWNLELLEGVITLLKIAAEISLGVMVVVLFQRQPIPMTPTGLRVGYQAKSRLFQGI